MAGLDPAIHAVR